MRGVVSRVSQRICILRMVTGVDADTSVLLRCYYAFILPILEYCSLVWGSAASSHLRLLDRQIHAVSRLCPDQILKPLNHRRCVAGMCMLHKIHSNPKHCLYLFLYSFLNSCGTQRPSRRLHRRRLFFYPLTGTEHGSQPSLTTRDRELVSVLEVRIEPEDLNQRSLTPQSVTLRTLPRAASSPW